MFIADELAIFTKRKSIIRFSAWRLPFLILRAMVCLLFVVGVFSSQIFPSIRKSGLRFFWRIARFNYFNMKTMLCKILSRKLLGWRRASFVIFIWHERIIAIDTGLLKHEFNNFTLAEKAALFARAEFFHQLALFARKVFGNLDIDHDDLSATLFAAKSWGTVPG